MVATALLQQSYLPSGMELFPSSPGMTWPYIQEAIRLSDYYVLILGKTYGSIFPGEELSWTEKEFEFATEIKKPLLVFLARHNPDEIEPATLRFRARISDERLVKFWQSGSELVSSVLGSLADAVRQYPAAGWVRTDAFLDEEESMMTFYRRSADFDFSSFLMSPGDIRIMVNDGFNWLRKYESAVSRRFTELPQASTFVLHISPQSPLLQRIAQKSNKNLAQQRRDIIEFNKNFKSLARAAGYEKLDIFGHERFNTHCLYICQDYAIATTYFTSDNRFLHLPLYKFRSKTSIYDDFFLDFDLLFREARTERRR